MWLAAESWIGDPALGVDDQPLMHCGSQRLGDAAFDLAAALHGIHDDARVGGVECF